MALVFITASNASRTAVHIKLTSKKKNMTPTPTSNVSDPNIGILPLSIGYASADK
jgi:hypothetical protein